MVDTTEAPAGTAALDAAIELLRKEARAEGALIRQDELVATKEEGHVEGFAAGKAVSQKLGIVAGLEIAVAEAEENLGRLRTRLAAARREAGLTEDGAGDLPIQLPAEPIIGDASVPAPADADEPPADTDDGTADTAKITLDTLVDDAILELQPAIWKAFKAEGLRTVKALIERDRNGESLVDIRNVGEVSLGKLSDKLQAAGLGELTQIKRTYPR